MSIQSGINQLLGMGAIFSQLPGGQNIKKVNQLKQQLPKTVEQGKIAASEAGRMYREASSLPKEEGSRILNQHLRDRAANYGAQADINKELFERTSNPDYYRDYMTATQGRTALQNLAQKHQQAITHMQEQGQQQYSQNQGVQQLIQSVQSGGTGKAAFETPDERREAIYGGAF